MKTKFTRPSVCSQKWKITMTKEAALSALSPPFPAISELYVHALRAAVVLCVPSGWALFCSSSGIRSKELLLPEVFFMTQHHGLPWFDTD